MLARTIDARATRDIDLLATRGDLDEALDEVGAEVGGVGDRD